MTVVNHLSCVKTQGQSQNVGIQARGYIYCTVLSINANTDFLLGVTSGCVGENCSFVHTVCYEILIFFQI